MALFTIADLHLSFSVQKPMDVFGNRWKDYEKRLEKAWCERIAPEDTVVLPGDFSWGMTLEEARADFCFLASLPGKKILLKGNHDYWWTSLAKMNAFLETGPFSDLSFLQNDAVLAEDKIICGSRGWMCEEKMSAQDEKVLHREAQRFELSLKAAQSLRKRSEEETGFTPEILVFSHYPVAAIGPRENPILPLLESYGVKRVYYGHLHNWENKPLCTVSHGIRFTLVSSDYLHFIPLQIK